MQNNCIKLHETIKNKNVKCGTTNVLEYFEWQRCSTDAPGTLQLPGFGWLRRHGNNPKILCQKRCSYMTFFSYKFIYIHGAQLINARWRRGLGNLVFKRELRIVFSFKKENKNPHCYWGQMRRKDYKFCLNSVQPQRDINQAAEKEKIKRRTAYQWFNKLQSDQFNLHDQWWTFTYDNDCLCSCVKVGSHLTLFESVEKFGVNHKVILNLVKDGKKSTNWTHEFKLIWSTWTISAA